MIHMLLYGGIGFAAGFVTALVMVSAMLARNPTSNTVAKDWGWQSEPEGQTSNPNFNPDPSGKDWKACLT